ncbi:MAG: DUF748 domain-containing protein [Desulfobacteraceae bacterium]|nr:MAG: DUF748 domain-containing protein [Desulfobacteraceae bacterium]
MSYLKKAIRSKTFIVDVALVLVYTVCGFLLAPCLVRYYVPKVANERFGREASVGLVRINPYILTFEMNDLLLKEPDGRPMIGFKRLFIDFETKGLFKWAWNFRHFTLEGLDVHAVIEKNGRLNLESLASTAEPASADQEGSPPPRLIVENILIDQARFEVRDERQSEPASIVIHPLTLQMKDFITLPQREGTQTISAATAGGERFEWTGSVTLNPVSVKGSFSVDGLKIRTLSQFARDSLNLDNPDGKINVSGRCEVDLTDANTKALVTDLDVALRGMGLRLKGQDRPFLEVPEVLLSGGRFDLAGRKGEIGGIRINGGAARILKAQDGTLNLLRIAKSRERAVSAAAQPPGPATGTPWMFALSGLDLDRFTVEYLDLSRKPGIGSQLDRLKVNIKAEAEFGNRIRLVLKELDLNCAGATFGELGSEPGLKGGLDRIIVKLKAEAEIGDQTRIVMNGFDLEGVSGNFTDPAGDPAMKIEVDRIKVGLNAEAELAQKMRLVLKAFDYGAAGVNFSQLKREPGLTGRVDRVSLGMKADAEIGDTTRAAVREVVLKIDGVEAGFAGAEKPTLDVERAGMEGGVYDLAENRFTAETFFVERGSADVALLKDGKLNLAVLFGQDERKPGAKPTVQAGAQGRQFEFLVRTGTLSGIQVAFSDQTTGKGEPLLHLDDISAKASNVSGRSPMNFNMGFRIREGGRIEASGTLDPSKPSLDSDVLVAGLNLASFQPYLGKTVEATLESGTFSTRGKLRHLIQAAGARTAYDGGFKVENLKVLEQGGKETFVGWRSVGSDQLKLRLGPDSLDVGEVRVSELTGKVMIDKEGKLNLPKVVKSDSKPKGTEQKTPPAKAGEFPYKVKRVVMDKGRVDFADLSLPIPFGTRVHELKGFIAGISSSKNTRAKVKLDGLVDDYGTANVGGEMDTSDPKTFTDINVNFRNVEMTRLTPYSGKFAGRRIDSGKLSVDLKYKIAASQLAGENQIVVERLKLGEKIESPDAVNLPLDLAVALLEDSNGVIDLGLPVRGDLSSPEFSYGGLIFKALVNVITKIITSPFRALAALIPGAGEESFKAIAFDAGSAEVPPPEREKLAHLAKALQKRPQLKLAVQGQYNPESDRSVLRAAALRSALAGRVGEKLEPGLDPGPPDYSNPKTGKALEAMFKERFGPEPLKNLKRELKDARENAKKEESDPKGKEAEDPWQLAKILYARLEEVEPVDDAALVRLADSRAQAIVGELRERLGISPERLNTLSSVAVEQKDPAAAALSLEIMR